MVVNSKTLLEVAPIEDMLEHKVYAHGVSHGMSEAGYDIRIRQAIYFSKGWFGRRNIERLDPPQGNEWETKFTTPGRFIIASAIERFQMPTDLIAIVHDKSSWARRGLSVLNTCIESGWKGFLTLELVYHGNEELFIPAGSGIAQVIFHKVTDPMSYKGRYQNQEDRPVAAISS